MFCGIIRVEFWTQYLQTRRVVKWPLGQVAVGGYNGCAVVREKAVDRMWLDTPAIYGNLLHNSDDWDSWTAEIHKRLKTAG